jgi:hypothetical protein
LNKIKPEKPVPMPDFLNGLLKMMQNGANYAKVKSVPPQLSFFGGEIVGKIYSTCILA